MTPDTLVQSCGLDFTKYVIANCHTHRVFVASPSGERYTVNTPTGWFWLQCTIAAVSLCLGIRIGKGPTRRIALWLILGLFMLVCWAWIKYHPALAVHAIPLPILYYIEGTAAVPSFMLIIGIAYTRSRLPRQKRLAVLSILLGGIYFVHGGIWMLQSTPKKSFANMVSGSVVLQSQDYSCVPAACATALRGLGVSATELEMAELTRVRPGTGATMIRAAEALQKKLGQNVRTHILELPFDQLTSVEPPMLTPLQVDLSRRHMVVLVRVGPDGAWVADPMRGMVYMTRQEMRQSFTNRVIVFESVGG